MKTYFNQLTAVALLLTTTAFTSCEKADSEKPVGFNIVYIPQSISSGGTNLNYNVPMGFGNTRNFEVDSENNKVNVLLGVSKSGKAETEAFTVDLTTRADTVTQLIASGSAFELLPASTYSMPQNVSFASGESSVSFNLSVDKTVLKTYAGKKMAVCVVLSNPTNAAYTLSDKNKQVIVIIDVDALKLN